MDEERIRVIIETQELVTGAADWQGLHICDYAGTGKTPFSDLEGKSNRIIPSSTMPLLYAMEAVADKIPVDIELVDVASLSFWDRFRIRRAGPVPRVEINEEILPGCPTSAEIIEKYEEICSV